MKMFTAPLLLCLLAILPVNLRATPDYSSSYAGQESRQIKSLSEDDVRQLMQGKGWGLARAAELNGMPGPAHILQMKHEIALGKEQEDKVRALFEDMQAKAIPLGKKLITLEKELNDAFASGTVTREQLMQLLESIAQVRKELRYVHLATHLQTPAILTPAQVRQYNRLRGYGAGDPCQNVPRGHDADMWKQHNNCK